MAIQVYWQDDENTRVVMIDSGNSGIDALGEAYEALLERFDTVDHAVDLIVDMHQSTRIPEGMSIMLKKVMAAMPEGKGTVYVAGNNDHARALTMGFKQVFPRWASRLELLSKHADIEAGYRRQAFGGRGAGMLAALLGVLR